LILNDPKWPRWRWSKISFKHSLTVFLFLISVLLPSGRSWKKFIFKTCPRFGAIRPDVLDDPTDKWTRTVLTFVSTSGMISFLELVSSFFCSRLSNWIDKFGLLIYIGFRSSAYTLSSLSITHHLWLINYHSGSSRFILITFSGRSKSTLFLKVDIWLFVFVAKRWKQMELDSNLTITSLWSNSRASPSYTRIIFFDENMNFRQKLQNGIFHHMEKLE